jgi:hypothetical protein
MYIARPFAGGSLVSRLGRVRPFFGRLYFKFWCIHAIRKSRLHRQFWAHRPPTHSPNLSSNDGSCIGTPAPHGIPSGTYDFAFHVAFDHVPAVTHDVLSENRPDLQTKTNYVFHSNPASLQPSSMCFGPLFLFLFLSFSWYLSFLFRYICLFHLFVSHFLVVRS